MAATPTDGTTPVRSRDAQLGSAWNNVGLVNHMGAEKEALFESLRQRYDAVTRENAQLRAQQQLYYRPESEEVLRNELRHMQNIMNSNPFVLVLLDGDGMIFDRSFLSNGEKGGRQAASLLKDAITSFIPSIDSPPQAFTILVQVFANLSGLADSCAKAGIVDSPTKVLDFARGFTQYDSHFNFVDVGPGKDRASKKINDSFKLFLGDWHCRQVVFGCSHDDAYARTLEQYLENDEVLQRVTLLEGVPFEKELDELPFRKYKAPDKLFRDKKLEVMPPKLLVDFRPRNDSKQMTPSATTPSTPRTLTPSLSTPLSSPDSNGLSEGFGPRTGSMSSTQSQLKPMPVASSWARTAASAASLPQKTVAPTAAPVGGVVRRNKKGQRIDDPLTYELVDLQRVKKMKLCNQHYLGINGCTKPQSKCHHDHSYKPSNAELKTLRAVARETPCKQGTACDDPKCIYGHKCPFPVANEGTMRGIGCLMGENCRFPRDMHAVDMVPVQAMRVVGSF